MSCSTGTYDCSFKPSGIWAIVDMRDLGESKRVPIVELEVCSGCRLLRLPNEDEQIHDSLHIKP
jgi:hypothetical protein